MCPLPCIPPAFSLGQAVWGTIPAEGLPQSWGPPIFITADLHLLLLLPSTRCPVQLGPPSAARPPKPPARGRKEGGEAD